MPAGTLASLHLQIAPKRSNLERANVQAFCYTQTTIDPMRYGPLGSLILKGLLVCELKVTTLVYMLKTSAKVVGTMAFFGPLW
jgi:hypothetical protein